MKCFPIQKMNLKFLPPKKQRLPNKKSLSLLNRVRKISWTIYSIKENLDPFLIYDLYQEF